MQPYSPLGLTPPTGFIYNPAQKIECFPAKNEFQQMRMNKIFFTGF
jgi:hypothetical protein